MTHLLPAWMVDQRLAGKTCSESWEKHNQQQDKAVLERANSHSGLIYAVRACVRVMSQRSAADSL